VGFDTIESANNAIEGMNGKEFEGKHLKVHHAYRAEHTIIALFHVSCEERSTQVLSSTSNFLAGMKGWFKRPQVLVSSKLNSCAPSI